MKTLHMMRNRQYSPTALSSAYDAVRGGRSVLGAAKQYGVPEITLRDHVSGKVHIDVLSAGREPLFSLDEEILIVEHLKTMAAYGYGYTRQEVVDIATQYANILGKRSRDNPMSLKWMRGFLNRWPELRVLNPRSKGQIHNFSNNREIF